MSEVDAFMTTQYLSEETDALPWFSAEQGLDYPSLMLQRFDTTKDLLQVNINMIKMKENLCCFRIGL